MITTTDRGKVQDYASVPTCSQLFRTAVITVVPTSTPARNNRVDAPASVELFSYSFTTFYSLVSLSDRASSSTLLGLNYSPVANTMCGDVNTTKPLRDATSAKLYPPPQKTVTSIRTQGLFFMFVSTTHPQYKTGPSYQVELRIKSQRPCKNF